MWRGSTNVTGFSTTSRFRAELAEKCQGIGALGMNSLFRTVAYAPPHSKGPGAKTYTLTLYALSSAPPLSLPVGSSANQVTLLATIKGHILGIANLKVVYTRNIDNA